MIKRKEDRGKAIALYIHYSVPAIKQFHERYVVLSVVWYYSGRARPALMCCVLCKDSKARPLSSTLPGF